jgi:hypothetical protein
VFLKAFNNAYKEYGGDESRALRSRTRRPRKRQQKRTRKRRLPRHRTSHTTRAGAPMPICEIDPWRTQYFEAAHCRSTCAFRRKTPMRGRGTRVIAGCTTAWRSRKARDSTRAARHDAAAVSVFSKPIVNLKGMGLGTRVLRTADDYDQHCTAGHMWMTLLTGRHVSSGRGRGKRRGQVVASRHGTSGRAAERSTYWTVHAEADPALEASLRRMDRRAPCRIHRHGQSRDRSAARSSKRTLRVTDQWPDLYGRGWVDALVHLYAHGEWIYADRDRRDGYSVVLFERHDVRWRHPTPRQIEDIRSLPGVSSVQITFHEERDPPLHAMPPGGFRLAIINGWNLDVGLAARNRLRMYFLSRATESANDPVNLDSKASSYRKIAG